MYAAATQSLAALEILVHVDTDLVANDYVVFAVDIPDDMAVESIALADLPPNWREDNPPLGLPDAGGHMARTGPRGGSCRSLGDYSG